MDDLRDNPRLSLDELRLLVARAKSGDSNAFARLYGQYLTPLYRYVLFRVRRREDAEDLTQTLFLKAFESLECYRDTGVPFSAWLYTIARNLIIDYFKKKKPVRLEDQEVLCENLIEPMYTAERDAVGGEERHLLARALSGLSEIEQTVVIMRSIDERSYEEIAITVGKSEEAVRAIKHRALVRMQKVAQKYK